MVITMAKLRMAHASMHGARKHAWRTQAAWAKNPMQCLSRPIFLLQAHSELHKHEEPSLVSISTVLFPPKFCSLHVPSNKTDWIPPPNFKNRRHNIECLNAAIAAINKGAKLNYLNVHLEGIRVDKPSNKVLHKHNPKLQVWRETEVRRRLHLTPTYKVKVMARAAKLLVGALKTLGCGKIRTRIEPNRDSK